MICVRCFARGGLFSVDAAGRSDAPRAVVAALRGLRGFFGVRAEPPGLVVRDLIVADTSSRPRSLARGAAAQNPWCRLAVGHVRAPFGPPALAAELRLQGLPPALGDYAAVTGPTAAMRPRDFHI